MALVPSDRVERARLTREQDLATGTQRVSVRGFSAQCQASKGAFILTHDHRYWPSFCNFDFTPIWGGYFFASPNPFRAEAT